MRLARPVWSLYYIHRQSMYSLTLYAKMWMCVCVIRQSTSLLNIINIKRKSVEEGRGSTIFIFIFYHPHPPMIVGCYVDYISVNIYAKGGWLAAEWKSSLNCILSCHNKVHVRFFPFCCLHNIEYQFGKEPCL